MLEEPPIKGRIQEIREFSAQVCRLSDGKAIGTAFVIHAEDGLLVTCRHVVQSASNSFHQNSQVNVFFPQAVEPNKRSQRAVVFRYDSDHDDDIVILQLKNLPVPDGVSAAVLGISEYSVGQQIEHRFESYGFREFDKYKGLPASGDIVNYAELSDRKLRKKPLMLRSENIGAGMSGSAVLDKERNLVIGLIFEAATGQTHKDRDAAFACVSEVIAELLPQTNILHPEYYYPLRPALHEISPKSIHLAENDTRIFPLPPDFHGVPRLLKEEWISRDDLLEALDRHWVDPRIRIVGLIGLGGEGKSCLARQWIDSVIQNNHQEVHGVFWWNFYEYPDVQTFLDTAITYLGSRTLLTKIREAKEADKVQVIAEVVKNHNIIFVLDGLEVLAQNVQHEYWALGPDADDLKRLMDFIATTSSQSLCLILSRFYLEDAGRYNTYAGCEVGALAVDQAVKLLEQRGVQDGLRKLEELVNSWDRHALTLSLLADEIIYRHNGKIPDTLPRPQIADHRYLRLERLLDYYNKGFSEETRELLQIVAVFRGPVGKSAFDFIWLHRYELSSLLGSMKVEAFEKTVTALKEWRVLRENEDGNYSLHALVLDYYRGTLKKRDSQEIKSIHNNIAVYYLSTINDESQDWVSNRIRATEALYHHYRDPMGQSRDLRDVLQRHLENTVAFQTEFVLIDEGHYLLGKRLAVGGFGMIYEAYDCELRRWVAVKRLTASLVAEQKQNALDIFEREIEMVAKLNHPYIVPIHDSGFDESLQSFYIVMALLSGGDLNHRMSQIINEGGSFTLEEIAQFLDKMASALDYAHAEGVIHCDIKPKNIVFSNSNNPYLVDFGLAQWSKHSGIAATFGGSLLYMSPEQFSAYADAKSDQYSLGIVIYEMLTGIHPYPSLRQETEVVEIFKTHNEYMPTPPHELRRDVPEAVSQVLQKAMAKVGIDRFETVKKFCEAFAEAINERGTSIQDREMAQQALELQEMLAEQLKREQEIKIEHQLESESHIKLESSQDLEYAPEIERENAARQFQAQLLRVGMALAAVIVIGIALMLIWSVGSSIFAQTQGTMTPSVSPASTQVAVITQPPAASPSNNQANETEQTEEAENVTVTTVPTTRVPSVSPTPMTPTATDTATASNTPSITPTEAPILFPTPTPMTPWTNYSLQWVRTDGQYQNFNLAFMPADCFLMGNGRQQCISQDQWVFSQPVTNVEYGECFDVSACGRPAGNLFDPTGPRKFEAVVNIAGVDARRFCTWIGGWLVTEREWEYFMQYLAAPQIREWTGTLFGESFPYETYNIEDGRENLEFLGQQDQLVVRHLVIGASAQRDPLNSISTAEDIGFRCALPMGG